MAAPQSCDYLIVGGGAAGCVLANRLSADASLRVVLLEAGGEDSDPRIGSTGGFVELWGSELDWAFSTAEQPGLGGRRMVINQGKVLGGSSSINALMYVRGNRRNYDEWAAQGNTGWSWEEVLPYFRRSEDYEGGESEYHGVGGLLTVRACPDPRARSEHYLGAAVELGFDGPDWDYNGARQEDGAGPLQFNITADNRRVSAASAFLQPVLHRPNLEVQTGAHATRILFDGKRAAGVEFTRDGQTERVLCDGEVILCAGAFLSPKLLLLSGIGPAAELRQHAIPVRADLPGVGCNLQDHLQMPVIYRTRSALPMPTLLTGNVLFVRTSGVSSDGPPDLQLNFIPSRPAPLARAIPDFGAPICVFLPILVQPRSMGHVSLRSADPEDAPLIDPHYLESASDVRVLSEALELIRRIAATRAFSGLGDGELVPGPGAQVEGFVRSSALTLWHPAGTCRMGTDAEAVVDPQLRVRGVEGLRVADASVMPAVTSGNTYAPCLMIAEKAAEMVLRPATARRSLA
ncbi:MAG: FAD-dependent oxidoreductase [Candidatus Latescibacterota bacterium]